ncbi:CMP/dCMP deaminase zinc-binding protein [Gottschalkia acidurici 9a]|uniref:CMP/dCMP deaminase zinc-binding protein n=1 Tax=Gottschalkia acidurici (strain ATCC 7906 / DSM 604 / BCRC 14475 / CIP 104303 / KCTC 5404 / NCIMB 10678 / 9a) TaxID=1128398 RepID=K0AVG4_GOTA9|nr:cytidine/deoxycytidylate deaminase family protein [Gottschalkia acidurici]AFS77274.1 CMP/dCMP deaminase zinc-binding protein [Gottschalkia acidurici 9a]
MRPTWDEYFMEIANVAKKRSTCSRRQVGAVIVKEKRILSTGYNGVPTGIKHCDEVGCLRDKLKIPSGERHELCRGLHAEQNAIVNAANFGVSLKGSILYSTTQPCILCTKMIINAGIEKVVYENGYPDGLSLEMLKEAGIELLQI